MLKKIFLGAGVILLPFAFQLSGDDQLRVPKAKALFLLAAVYGAIELWKRVDPLLAISAAFIAFSACFSHTAFHTEDLLYVLGAFVAALWLERPTENDQKVFLKLLELSGLFCAAYAALQIIGKDPFLNYYAWADRGRPVILFGQHTLYGPWAVACFAAALFQRHWGRSFVLILPIFFINSSFTFLSLGAVLFVFALSRFTKWAIFWMTIAGAIASIGLFIAKPGVAEEAMNDKGRFALWSQTIELANRHPVFGYGFGTFKTIYPVFQDKRLREANGIRDEDLGAPAKEFIKKAELIRAEGGLFLQAHNEFIEAYFSGGLVGLLLALLLPINFLFVFWRMENKTTEAWALAAIFFEVLANSLGNFPMHLIPQALLPLWAYVAVTTQGPAGILEVYVEPGFQRALSLFGSCLRRGRELRKHFVSGRR